MYAVIIDQYTLHLEIRLLAVLLVFEFDEGILKAFLGSLVSDNFARYDFAKSTEDQIKIFV